ncbi:MAG: IclR family transcriptional regulator [Gammaproteobacteria bacterium HGW-Gammaproteobacteria-12]|nr:MAG: IclR family transcriptional regulator [Gammaproteobacteria bacterium HGW-Gammaproteobacteria-12]
MSDTRPPLSSLAPPPYVSPAKRIEEFAGDPNFMTSLARGLAVINAFQERKRHLTIAQISHRTEIPRAAVRRCLYSLMKLGYVTTDGRTYSLLPKVLTLGHAYLSSTPLAVSAQPYLDRLSSVDLSVGSRLPAYCTSMGRILLAALDDDQLQDYLAHAELQPKTSRTLHTPEALWECLQRVRHQGWCIVDQELEQGLRSLAVPVYDSAGHVLAAMNVSTHAGRVPVSELEKRYLPLMLNASRELSSQLFRPT